jgi:hypothetical protein
MPNTGYVRLKNQDLSVYSMPNTDYAILNPQDISV